jgi:hypothetical protein
MLNFIHIFGLTLFTLLFKYFFLKDLYFYIDDFAVFSDFERTNSIFPMYTDRPLFGIFLLPIFQILKWNSILYHLLGAILEVSANLTVYYICMKIIWRNKFYSSLTVLFFLLIPGHSQQYWWNTLLPLKVLLIMWLGSIYTFYKFILSDKFKYLIWSSFLYGITLFWYELALFLPVIHLLIYAKLVIIPKRKIITIKAVKVFSCFIAYIFFFVLFRATKSFGFSASFDRSQFLPFDQIFARVKNILKLTFWLFPQMENNVGSHAFKSSPFTDLSIVLLGLIFAFLIVTYFSHIFKLLGSTSHSFTTNDYTFTLVFAIGMCLYPLIPFFFSPAWFDTRHTYLSHLGLAILIVLMIKLVLDNAQKLPKNYVKYLVSVTVLFSMSLVLVQYAESILGNGVIYREVGLDLKNYEAIVKKQFPTVQPHTLFLFKDTEKLRNGYVPVFAGDWVVNGFISKIYPLQDTQGHYYSLLDENHPEKSLLKINSDLNSLSLNQDKYLFSQIIILDAKNKFRSYSEIKIKNSEGDHIKRLQTSSDNDSINSVLEISIP